MYIHSGNYNNAHIVNILNNEFLQNAVDTSPRKFQISYMNTETHTECMI